MGKYLDDVHSCVSISNGMRHSNDYIDMNMPEFLSIFHIGNEIRHLDTGREKDRESQHFKVVKFNDSMWLYHALSCDKTIENFYDS